MYNKIYFANKRRPGSLKDFNEILHLLLQLNYQIIYILLKVP